MWSRTPLIPCNPRDMGMGGRAHCSYHWLCRPWCLLKPSKIPLMGWGAGEHPPARIEEQSSQRPRNMPLATALVRSVRDWGQPPVESLSSLPDDIRSVLMPCLFLSSKEDEWPWVAEEGNYCLLQWFRLVHFISPLFKCLEESSDN